MNKGKKLQVVWYAITGNIELFRHDDSGTTVLLNEKFSESTAKELASFINADYYKPFNVEGGE